MDKPIDSAATGIDVASVSRALAAAAASAWDAAGGDWLGRDAAKPDESDAGAERAVAARQYHWSPVMARARDWLSFASPRESGWALIRDLAAENDRLYHALEVLAEWPLERTRFEAERFAKEALDGQAGAHAS